MLVGTSKQERNSVIPYKLRCASFALEIMESKTYLVKVVECQILGRVSIDEKEKCICMCVNQSISSSDACSYGTPLRDGQRQGKMKPGFG